MVRPECLRQSVPDIGQPDPGGKAWSCFRFAQPRAGVGHGDLHSVSGQPRLDDDFGAFLLGRNGVFDRVLHQGRSEEHTSELQSLMRISYAVFCLKKKKKKKQKTLHTTTLSTSSTYKYTMIEYNTRTKPHTNQCYSM